MNQRRKKLNYYIAGLIISLSLNMLLVSSLEFHFSLKEQLIAHFSIWTSVYIAVQFPKIVLPPLTVGCFAAAWKKLEDKADLFYEVHVFFIWSLEYIMGLSRDIPPKYDVYLVLSLSILTCLTVVWVILGGRRKLAIPLFSILFILQWFRYVEEAVVCFNIYVFGMGLLYISEHYMKKLQEALDNNKIFDSFQYHKYTGFGIIVIFFIIVTANMVQLNFAPLEVAQLNDAVTTLFPGISDWRNEDSDREYGDRFDFRETPYQPQGQRLGGKVNDDNRLMMLVKADRTLYLRGTVKDYYSGTSWISTHDSFMESSDGMIEVNISENQAYGSAHVDIYPVQMHTATIFTPYRPMEIKSDSYKIYYNSDLEIYKNKLFFENKMKPYTVVFQLPTVKDKRLTGETAAVSDKMKEYLQLPKDLPQRVQQLAKDITRPHVGSYNKMKAIEGYLRKQYPYTIQVDELPKNKDFVDFFLFEEKKGYCTYFASTMAVLGRNIGIPTRYVEGFLLPNRKNSEGLYEVTANMAHAWVEAYIEDMGWITFEPTPAYQAVSPVLYTSVAVEEADELNSIAYQPMERSITNQNYLFYKFKQEDETNTNSNIGKDVLEKTKKTFRWSIFVVLLFLLFLARLLYCWIKNRNVHDISNKESIQRDYLQILNIIKKLKKVDFNCYTPREMLLREGKDTLTGFIDEDVIITIEKAFYDDEEMRSQDMEIIRDLKKYAELRAKEEMGFVKFFIHRMILGNY